ncbi:beta-glucosidase [Neorhodopirellula lusitana]|uniref:Beta-glucosidase n=1 Tax=Neorhodopirellula lusitana TaxID=445327 RepID=A0ABY1Q3I1_9BACT|nr:glycoside hydrolase family 3 N-terminal domain-containing protein [Neorhodopirellula lusitana]SMP58174.1 beta-glucosidase [Neorhodopirellula lusitana]
MTVRPRLTCLNIILALLTFSAANVSAEKTPTTSDSKNVATAGDAAADPMYHDGWVDRNKNGKMDPYENPKLSVAERVQDLIDRMTMDEKTCQMATIYGYRRVLKSPVPEASWNERVWKDGVANIDEHANGVRAEATEYIAFDKHANLINTVQHWFAKHTRLGIPVDFTNEGIRGICHPNACNFPTQLGLGASWDRELVRRIGEITGREAKVLGYSNIYSPILDTARDPRWGRSIECYSEDPYLVGELGKEQVLGLQSQNVASTVKHFAAYSNPNGGRDGGGRTDPQVPFHDMQEILLAPFRKVFKECSPKGTMSSYNTYDGVPVSGSSYFLIDLLRKEYGFNGYVVSDSGAVTRIERQHKVAETFEHAVAQSINAGLNVRTTFQKMENFVMPLRQVVKKGWVTEDTINSRVADVLRVKFELGLFDTPFLDPQEALDVVHCDDHSPVTLEAARKAIVLLKNENKTLPLDSSTLRNVLVTGPGANEADLMISRYGPSISDVITPYEGIRRYLGDQANVVYEEGVAAKDSRFPKSDLIPEPPTAEEQALMDQAIAVAKKSDVIIAVLGDSNDTVGESKSRMSLDLPGHQTLYVQKLMETGKPVIVVLMPGRAAAINWIDENAPAILVCWHGGEQVGTAVAETLFGDNNPGGKLPITFPRTVGQVPMAVPYRHGAWGGQHEKFDPNGWGSTRSSNPLYFFGYGLSYTTFKYSHLKITPKNPTESDTIKITCSITNSGDVQGDEVVQLYIADLVASVTPYEQVLRGFDRVALEPGETKQVTFSLSPKRDLVMLDRDNQWVVEPGEFEVRVASHSGYGGAQLKETIELKSKTPEQQ